MMLERTMNIKNNMICFLKHLKLKNRPLVFCNAVVFSNVNDSILYNSFESFGA